MMAGESRARMLETPGCRVLAPSVPAPSSDGEGTLVVEVSGVRSGAASETEAGAVPGGVSGSAVRACSVHRAASRDRTRVLRARGWPRTAFRMFMWTNLPNPA